MKKLLALALMYSLSVFANPIDITCPKLTYKSAPIVNADQYVCHQQYAIAYSWATRDPIYTTEFLTKDHTGNLPRTNDFQVDPVIEPHHSATPNDYKNSKTACGPITSAKRTSSCDQGHMTPDQDFSACDICVHQSFFMSNMVPQNYQNNEIIWKYMEIHIRGYVANNLAGAYIITGPVFYPNATRITIGKNQVWVPDALFKIMIDAKTGKSIAFMMPNSKQDTKALGNFVVSLDDIEKATGLKFDVSLDKKTKADYQAWLLQTK